MPTIEIEVPEGRPYQCIERVHRERGISYLAMLLHGADELTVPQPDNKPIKDHECEWRECQHSADARIRLQAHSEDGVRDPTENRVETISGS